MRRLATGAALALFAACGVSSVAIDESVDDTSLEAPDTSSDDAGRDAGEVDDADVVEASDAPRDMGAGDDVSDALADESAGADAADDSSDGSNPDADTNTADTGELDSSVLPDVLDTTAECADGTLCGRECVDLASDVTNCGFCGVTCVIPSAEAACLDSACAIGRCDFGYFDADGDVANGCELEDLCIAEQPCSTSCGGASVTRCVEGVAVCAIPAEACNLADDNCNGACDEGPIGGCRVGIHRANGNGHVYSDDLGFVSSAPYSVEAVNFFYLYTAPGFGMRPVFLCRKPNGRRLLSNDTACEVGVEPERQIGFWSPTPLCGAIPLYRLYSEADGNHFFTTSEPERNNARDNLGYLDEGIAGYVWQTP